MHELSIAHGLVSAAVAAADREGISHVESVQLRLGVMSGVVADSLLFGYDVATAGTLLEGSTLQIEPVEVAIWCPTCQAEKEIVEEYHFVCPDCDTPSGRLVRGREIQIVSLEYT
jgi:hydrogenase nickel incorporation protein HypA/HybF